MGKNINSGLSFFVDNVRDGNWNALGLIELILNPIQNTKYNVKRQPQNQIYDLLCLKT